MTGRRASGGQPRDAGNAAVELAPVAIVLISFLILIIIAGRIITAQLAVSDAAHDAARQASIARSPAAAQAAADQSALSALTANHLHCAPGVTVDTGGFAVPVGQPAQVTVTVTCQVQLPALASSRTVTATASSPLDIFRAR